ncbi:hypothetical protein [Marinomonas sp. TW1]|uniref:hypothetical protein n=1 Tax=Marinomonas sp. TW1 TaxID=1561203 RepID=UPI0007AF5B79|nr:hypothetical protein [Marinomonas sp. TW1]KZN12284.1 hypothetical protein OA79_16910 [Marinomonas sp. TW1]
MKNKILPWSIALGCAIVLHILLLEWSAPANWLSDRANVTHPELFILKTNASPQSLATDSRPLESSVSDEQQNTSNDVNRKQPTDVITSNKDAQIEAPEMPSSEFNHQTDWPTEQSSQLVEDLHAKSPLLELSPPSSSQDDSETDGIFSPTLRAKIEKAKQDQEAYLKGQQEETAYPITEDADGTKYVNIEGVCWRIPEPGSDTAWAIVFAGCNGQKETFHFELNIAPSTFLGPDGAFPLAE